MTQKSNMKSKHANVNHIDGLAQDCSNSIANALELRQSCIWPSICNKSQDNETWETTGSWNDGPQL